MTNASHTQPSKSFFHGEAIHPEKWEKLLKDVTQNRDAREIPFDPSLMEELYTKEDVIAFLDGVVDYEDDRERVKQIGLVRRIAQRKLKGLTRYCILIVLMTGAGPKHLSKMLGISPTQARRVLARGIQVIKNCLTEPTGDFPPSKGTRPMVRVTIFSLDTPDERNRFLQFINENTIVHLSYRGDDMFREVLVVYIVGKAARRISGKD